jgi:hypothetical protein
MRRPLAATLVLLGLPSASLAVELGSGISSEGYWTDNVYAQSVGEVDDFSIRVSPWGEVLDRDGDLTWGLRYHPSYEYDFHEDDINGFDHDVLGNVGWRVTPQTTLRLAERYQKYHSLSRFNEQQAPGEDVVVAGRRVEYESNAVTAGIEHFLSVRDLLVVNASFTQQMFSEVGQRDRDFYGTSLVYRHRWSERITIGAVGSWSRQTVETILAGEDELQTDYYNVSGLFTYLVSPTLTFEVSAGPALIQSDTRESGAPAGGFNNLAEFPRRQGGGGTQFLLDEDTCPQDSNGNGILSGRCQIISPALNQAQLATVSGVLNGVPLVGSVPSADDSTTTYFADVALIKDWERWRGELSYTRSEDRSTGFGAVSDIFYGSLRWQVARRLSAKVIASYEIREQSTEQVFFVPLLQNSLTGIPVPPLVVAARTVGVGAQLTDTDTGLDVFITSLQLNYDLSPRASVYTTLFYRDEQSDGEVFLERDMQRFSITVGLRYVFDPIDL